MSANQVKRMVNVVRGVSVHRFDDISTRRHLFSGDYFRVNVLQSFPILSECKNGQYQCSYTLMRENLDENHETSIN